MSAFSNFRSESSTILITGGCGYLGSQLIRDLAQESGKAGLNIRILDNMQSGNYQALMDLPSGCEYQFMEGDILDPAALRLALEGVDTVIHLAAVVRTPMSFEHPEWVKQVNYWGTVQVVEACLELGVERLIYSSTSAVYGPGKNFREHDPCRPLGPYAQSKCQAEGYLTQAARRGLKPTILRIGTIFGLAPVTRFDAVANRFAYLAGIGRSLPIYGTGDQVRPLIHVRDASRAILFCLAHAEQTTGEIYNLVSLNASIMEIASAVQTARPDAALRFTEQDILTHLSFDVALDKLLAAGWQPVETLSSGLKEIIDRFQNLQPVSSSVSSLDPDL